MLASSRTEKGFPMQLHPVDVAIVAAYLALLVGLGWLLSRRAGKDMEAYFLGGKGMPWYVLGISHGVPGFGMASTMWFALILYTYGVKGVYILWIWPMFAMVFRMVYLSAWARRSNVLTGAEWMRTRFGKRGGGDFAHLMVVGYAMLGVLGFLIYAFKGIVEFAEPFFPSHYSPKLYATVIICVTAAYLIAGGMYSVVVTHLIQYVLLTISAVGIAIIAIRETTPELIASKVPDGWSDISFGWVLQIDWSDRIPALQNQMTEDGWSLFTVFLMMLLFKGWLVSMAGPSPGYGIQHVLATRNPREAALESWGISVFVLFPRFLMIAAIVVLALVHLTPELLAMKDKVEFEQILPLVVGRHIPVGLTGIVVATLVASFMSTLDSVVHAGTAYIVNDLYKRYLHPTASPKTYVYVSYAVAACVVGLGIAFGFMTESISSVMKWLVSMLFGGYAAPNILKWHWWRFNGYGFFAGLLAGMAGAMIMPFAFPELEPLYAFPFVFGFSAFACVVVCLLTPPEDDELLERFYLTVRPWGLWRPVYQRLLAKYPDLSANDGFVRDMINCAVGIVWHTTIVLAAVYLVLQDYWALSISVLVVVATSVFLKRFWYNRLADGDGYLPEDDRPHGPSKHAAAVRS